MGVKIDEELRSQRTHTGTLCPQALEGDRLMQGSEESGMGGLPDGPTGFEIAVAHDPRGVQVKISGELDIATAPELDRVLAELAGGGELLADDGHGRLMIDLTGVRFIDSTGLGAIVRAHVNGDHNGHRVTVRRGDSPQVQRLLELTGMLDQLNFEDSPEADVR